MEALHETHSNRFYLTVWSGLLVLTILEVILAYIAVSVGLMLTLLIGFSLLKTALIVAYFMHLRFEKFSLTLTLIPALVICIILLFIFFPDSLRLLELRR